MTEFAVLWFSSLLAGYTFGPDQKAHFLQLARDGVSPWEIWLSRLAVMGAVLLPPATVALGAIWLLMAYNELSMLRPLAVLIVMLSYVSVLVIGQACSMFVRSRIIALVVAPVMTGCFASWIATGVFWAGLGWKLGAAPMLLSLLIGSRLLVGTRLRQDDSWRALRTPALLVIAAIVFTYQAFSAHRVGEIRPYDSMIQVDGRFIAWPPRMLLDYARSQDEAKRVNAPPRDGIEQLVLAQANEASEKWTNWNPLPWHQNSLNIIGQSKTGQVATYGDMLSADAELNRTLREVVTSRPEIPNERLSEWIDFLENWAQQRSRYAEWLAADYQRDANWLQYGPAGNGYRRVWFSRRTAALAFPLAFVRAKASAPAARPCLPHCCRPGRRVREGRHQ